MPDLGQIPASNRRVLLVSFSDRPGAYESMCSAFVLCSCDRVALTPRRLTPLYESEEKRNCDEDCEHESGCRLLRTPGKEITHNM